jgi:hypothetical protein
VQSALQQYQTVLLPPNENLTTEDMSQMSQWKITGQYTDGEMTMVVDCSMANSTFSFD